MLNWSNSLSISRSDHADTSLDTGKEFISLLLSQHLESQQSLSGPETCVPYTKKIKASTSLEIFELVLRKENILILLGIVEREECYVNYQTDRPNYYRISKTYMYDIKHDISYRPQDIHLQIKSSICFLANHITKTGTSHYT